MDALLQRVQIRPLATGIDRDSQLLQLCYTSEVANSALDVLQDAALPGKLHLREGFSLVALVGAGVCKNPPIATVSTNNLKINR